MEVNRLDIFNRVAQRAMSLSEDINPNDLVSLMAVEFEEYDIVKKETALVVYEGDKNAQMIKKFIITKQVNGLSKNTLFYYKSVLECFNRRTNNKPFDRITTDDLIIYFAQRDMRDKVNYKTRDNERRVLSTFFEWGVDNELFQKNPIRKLPRFKGLKEKKKAFTEMDIEKIREACKDNRERMIIEVLLSTGCRASELIQIKLSDISNNKVLVHGKGAKDRYVYLNARARRAIELHLESRKCVSEYLVESQNKRTTGNQLLRSGLEVIVRRIGEEADVPNTHPHRFRRTCATWALRRGMPLEQVSMMLGHESLETTQIYLDLNERDLELSHEKYVY